MRPDDGVPLFVPRGGGREIRRYGHAVREIHVRRTRNHQHVIETEWGGVMPLAGSVSVTAAGGLSLDIRRTLPRPAGGHSGR